MKRISMVWAASANPMLSAFQQRWLSPFVLLALVMATLNVQADELSKLRVGITERVKAFSTVDVTWTVTSHFEKASNKGDSRDPFGATATDQRVDDKLPATFEWQARLRCDGSKLRLEYARPKWDFGELRFTMPLRVFVFDGSAGKFLLSKEEASFPYRGVVTGPQMQWGRGMDFAPLLWHFRGFAYPGMLGHRFFDADAEISRETVRARPYIVITRDSGTGNSARKEVLWIEAEPLHSIRRLTQTQNGQLQCELRVDHFQKLGGRVVPWQWSLEDCNAEGMFRVSSHAKVLKALVNQPIADGVFNLEFPPGTMVRDEESEGRRFIFIGNNRREFEVTPRQAADASSAQQLLRMLDD